MDGCEKDVEQRLYGYSTVVSTLADVFGAKNEAGVMTIKSKLKYYQKNGFAPPSRGEGKDIFYTFYDIMDWALGLNLAKIGLPARFIIRNLGPGAYKRKIFRHLQQGTCYIWIFPSLVIDSMPDSSNPFDWYIISKDDDLHDFYENILEKRKINGKCTDHSIVNMSFLDNAVRERLVEID